MPPTRMRWPHGVVAQTGPVWFSAACCCFNLCEIAVSLHRLFAWLLPAFLDWTGVLVANSEHVA